MPAFSTSPTIPASPLRSVREFGAMGTGGDYTTQIQAAIDYASTIGGTGSPYGIGVLYCPAGLYRFSQLTMKSGVKFLGEGHGLGDAETGRTVFRKFGSQEGFIAPSVSYLKNVGATGIAFEQEDSSSGHVIDFAAAGHCVGLTLERFSVKMLNPNKSFLRFVECNPIRTVIAHGEAYAAQNHAVHLFDIETPAGSNIFGFSMKHMLLEGYPNTSTGAGNTVPLVLVADDGGAVSIGVDFEDITLEPGPGGGIEARGIYTGPVFTNVTSSDCLDTWPTIHLTKGTGSAYGYGPSTFVGCHLHNLVADPLQGCYSPVIKGCWIGRLDAQYNRPIVMGSRINILEGTTNPQTFGTSTPT